MTCIVRENCLYAPPAIYNEIFPRDKGTEDESEDGVGTVFAGCDAAHWCGFQMEFAEGFPTDSPARIDKAWGDGVDLDIGCLTGGERICQQISAALDAE